MHRWCIICGCYCFIAHRDKFSGLLCCSPDVFDRAFQRIYKRSPERAQVVARYLLADLVRFPVDLIEAKLPEIFSITSLLAKKAGCPFEWAFLLFLPLLGIACAQARLYTSSTAQGGGGSFKNRKPIGEIGCCESGMAERIH